MYDDDSVLNNILRQAEAMGIPPPPTYLQYTPKSNCGVEEIKLQDPLADTGPYYTTISGGMSEVFQGTGLRIDELSTIRKLLEQCTIDATRYEVIHVLEAACSHPEECIDCSYKNSLGECNRNERIADILLNRFGRVK